MRHPTDDMLLAYVRQQQRSLWPVELQEHLAHCSECNGRCRDFKLAGDMLEQWAFSSTANPLYATVSKRVMRTIHEQQTAPVTRTRSGIARARVALPLVVVLVLFASILLVGWGVNIMGNEAKSQQSQPTPPVVSQQPTASVPTPTLGPMPTVVVSPTTTGPTGSGSGQSTATSTPQSAASIQANDPHCTTAINIAQDQLRVCGENFTPNTTVLIYYHFAGSTKKHSAQVTANGTFIDVLYIHDCRGVPSSIYVQNTTTLDETAQITQNITFKTCQG